MLNQSFVIILYWIIGLSLIVVQCLCEPMALKSVADVLQCDQIEVRKLIGYLAFLLISTFASPIVKVVSNVIRERLVAQRVKELTSCVMTRLLRSDGSYFVAHNSDALIVQFSADRERCSSVYWSMVLDFPVAFVALLVMAMMMFTGSFAWLERLGFVHLEGNWILALVVLLMSPLHMIFLLFSKKVMSIEQKRTEAVCSENQNLMESLRGIDDICSYNAFAFVDERIRNMSKSFFRARLWLFCLSTAIEQCGVIAWGVTQVVLLVVSAFMICKSGIVFSYADYVGFSVLSAMFNSYITKISQIALEWQNSRQANVRMEELKRVEVKPCEDKVLPIKDGSVLLNEVFVKGKDGVEILKGVNLSVRNGEHVVVVGPSGGGKSTLMKTMSNALSVSSGAVLIGGVSLDDFGRADCARNIGYVPQTPFLFSGTILENILLGRDASDARVVEVLEEVGLIEDLKKRDLDLKKAVNEPLCQYATNLSGGQLAKLALARALLFKPNVLLLDEVTSPLDELSLWHVLKTLRERYDDKTVVLVTHRLEPARVADKIVVVNEGRIIQVGTFNELQQKEGLFKDLLSNGFVV